MQTAHSTHPAAWQRIPVAAAPRAGALAYFRGLSFSFWLLSQLFGFIFVSNWNVSQELAAEGFDIKQYFYVGFAVILFAQLTLGLNAWITAPFDMVSTTVGALLTAFCFWMAVLSPLSLIPMQSLIYAVATWGSALMLWLFWQNNYTVLKRCLVFACWVQFGWWLLLLAKHGMPMGIGFNIGDINRNITGTSALAALLCGLFSSNRYMRWAAFGVALFFIILVNSRGSIVALSSFLAAYYVCRVGVFRSALQFALLGVPLVAILLTVPPIRHQVVDKLFHLYDPARGITSGFTGRTEMWAQGIEYFWKQPVFGWGFRASSLAGREGGFGGVHSAFIKIFLEAGIIGAFVIIGAVLVEAIRRVRISFRLSRMKPRDLPGINLDDSLQLNLICGGMMFLTLTMWIYDQYYINLGSPISAMLFLLLMAPTYVTDQGTVLRR